MSNITPNREEVKEGSGSEASPGASRLTTPDQEPGYRSLVIGEVIEDSDEVWAYGSGPWEKVSCAGERYQKSMTHHPMRRALPAEAAPRPADQREAEPSSLRFALARMVGCFGNDEGFWEGEAEEAAAKGKSSDDIRAEVLEEARAALAKAEGK